MKLELSSCCELECLFKYPFKAKARKNGVPNVFENVAFGDLTDSWLFGALQRMTISWSELLEIGA